jgi:hypothetical protein
MRAACALSLVGLWIACGPPSRGDDTGAPGDACTGPECPGTECQKQGRPETTISGIAYAPNGTLPLYGVTVYVPGSDPGALPDGAQCTRCEESQLPGDPIAQAITDELGRFTLANVPPGVDVPLVITIGKWRRQIRIPEVAACTDNLLTVEQTRLPRTKSEGDLPRIAVVTGNCDALECLIRKIGVDDSEFTPDSLDGRIHMFASNGAARTIANQTFAPASALWSSVDKLKQYDIAMFGCECSQLAANKPQAAMEALKAYADAGGRAFLSHYNSVWISGENGNPLHAPPVWPQIATCNLETSKVGIGMIDELDNPRGPAFASWMLNVQASQVRGQVAIADTRQTCASLDDARAERWLYLQTATTQVLQNFQFTTPNELAEEERCGKVVFSDMHVSGGSMSAPNVRFPQGCSADPLTPQEKALAFMFFDLATCVGPIF